MPALPLLIVIFGFLPRSGGTQRPADRADHRDHRLGLGRPGAPRADAVAARTGTTWSRRGSSASAAGGSSASRSCPTWSPIIASSFLFTVLYGVGTYTALAFLGLVNPNALELGHDAVLGAGLQTPRSAAYWWWFIPPGLAVALLGTSLALLNFGIDEFINPRLRAAGLSAPPGQEGRRRPAAAAPLGLTPGVTAGQRAASGRAARAGQPGRDRGRRGAQAPAEPLLEVRGLRVDYGIGADAVHAVVDADLDAAPRARCSAWPARAAAASPRSPTRSPGCCAPPA